MSIFPVETIPDHNNSYFQERIDLSAAFHLAVLNDWHESIANHFSLAVSDNGKQFLMNPRWRHFSRISASNLMLLDVDDPETMNHPNAPDPSAWCIHGAIHRSIPQARCLLHVHSLYATALASLKDPKIKPVDQNTARFFNRVTYDMGFDGIAHREEEGERIASCLGNHKVMMMANHGVMVVGNSVAEAFDTLYYLERACKTLILAYSSGQPLNIMPDDLAERTARDWETYSDSAFSHFDEMKEVLLTRGSTFSD